MNEVFILVIMQLSVFASVILLAGIYMTVVLGTLLWAAVRLAKGGYEYARSALSTYRTPQLPHAQHNLEPKT